MHQLDQRRSKRIALLGLAYTDTGVPSPEKPCSVSLQRGAVGSALGKAGRSHKQVTAKCISSHKCLFFSFELPSQVAEGTGETRSLSHFLREELLSAGTDWDPPDVGTMPQGGCGILCVKGPF